jgi:SAM-dependent methyltransferase
VDTAVTGAYDARAAEYAEVLGTMAAVHPEDRALVEAWAASCTGTIVDAGCGPGHWTAHLAGLGHEVVGIDGAPSFVAHAGRTAPGIDFRVGDLDRLPLPDRSVGGVLSWYSLIHHGPERIGVPVAEIARVLRPGGRLLVGFFEGAEMEPFDHAVTTAHRWPVAAMERVLVAAGFVVEGSVRRAEAGQRPHGAVSAVLREALSC